MQQIVLGNNNNNNNNNSSTSSTATSYAATTSTTTGRIDQACYQQDSPTTDLDKWGSFHCAKFKEGKRCDLCSHMKETSVIESLYFSKQHRIHGHLAHDTIPEGKIRWYIYAIQDLPCRKIIVGSTQNPVKRWATHKSDCNQASDCKKKAYPSTSPLGMAVHLILAAKKKH